MAPWGKSIGDINGDGLIDLLVGGHQASKPSLMRRVLQKLKIQPIENKRYELVWYQNPGWERHVISDTHPIRTDLEVGDVDGDGKNDVVALTDEGVIWFKNPSWSTSIIDSRKFHDIELADLNLDNRLDVVVRSQSLFGYENGNEAVIIMQQPSGVWQPTKITIDHGEGLKVADINDDGYQDIVVNNFWLENPFVDHNIARWQRHYYAGNWRWNDVTINVYDINKDGRLDILQSPAESAKQYYRLSWFESPLEGDDWQEHIIENNIEAVHHSVAAGDFDGDGDADIFSAEMNQGENKNNVKVYINSGDSKTWQKKVLSKHGSHGMRVADLDGDFDDEVFGANWQIDGHWDDYPVRLWDSRKAKKNWKLHVVDDDKPWRHLFVFVQDIDSDGVADIVSGRNWYKNPGVLTQSWEKSLIGPLANNAILVKDFNGDGAVDILASKWDQLLGQPTLPMKISYRLNGGVYPGRQKGGEFVWAKNDGSGAFTVLNNIEAGSGDFLQGAAYSRAQDGLGAIFLSWHSSGMGIQQLQVPNEPENEVWPIIQVSPFSQDEALSIADVNNDKVDDLVTGTHWLNQANGWEVNTLTTSTELPDRNIVIDLNGDSIQDVLIGYEAVSKSGKIAWYDKTEQSNGLWKEHIIANVIGPMSLAATDMDGDGDIDVVVGEHNLQQPQEARLILFENTEGDALSWRPHLLFKGEEHHDGLSAVDIDGDGDKDIVSIGFGHSKIMIFENPDL